MTCTCAMRDTRVKEIYEAFAAEMPPGSLVRTMGIGKTPELARAELAWVCFKERDHTKGVVRRLEGDPGALGKDALPGMRAELTELELVCDALCPSCMRGVNEIRLDVAGWEPVFAGVWHHPQKKIGWMPFESAVILQTITDDVRNASPETRRLAQEAVDACKKREAELDAMSPADREKAISEWARKLATEVSTADD
jgi:hypothetical protein